MSTKICPLFNVRKRGPMNPRVATIVATGLLVSSVSFAGAPAGPVTCSITNASTQTVVLSVTLNEADQSAHAAISGCEYDLTGTVKHATRRRVKASNLDGGTDNPACCETMHIDLIKWIRWDGAVTVNYSFVCDGEPSGPLSLHDIGPICQ